MWIHKQTIYWKLTGQKPMSADCNISNKKKINLATFTYRNDAAYKSCVDGFKQAETSVFVPIYFFKLWNGSW